MKCQNIKNGFMKININNFITIIICFIILIPKRAYANSSWIWLTKHRPWDILPPAAFATIVIEVLAIWLIPHTVNFIKTALVVILANFISFFLPYVYLLIDPTNPGYSYLKLLETGPYYIVGGFFVFLTLFLEGPVVYNCLKNNVESKKKLIWTVIVSNITTTIMVAVIERMIAYGIFEEI